MSRSRHWENPMHRICILRLGRAALLAGFVTAGLIASASLMVAPTHARAIADESIRADFRVALEPYGAWRHNRRFGDVWVPANRSRDWRPYTVGRWAYTDDYGWYWVTDDQEADWGWITYHYGRWYRDADDGWFWVPDDVWGPAWVDWRYGDQYVGWAPEPPDEAVVGVEDEPAYWSFVTAGDLIAPSIATVLLPFDRRTEFFRRTALVNRPVMMRRRDRRFAVDPGIPPGNIAAIRGRALPTYQVRPRVLAGTGALPGAVQVRTADLRRQGANRPAARDRVVTRDIIRSSSTVRPTRRAPQLEPLGRGELGRLGAAPPLPHDRPPWSTDQERPQRGGRNRASPRQRKRGGRPRRAGTTSRRMPRRGRPRRYPPGRVRAVSSSAAPLVVTAISA
jgi:hypothetical protein